ncbi:chorismate--pyruvate lyase family protein [Janthinobacterium agaricidamnosum]|uniref:Probable chorismate pyruvate-lyase n=1 Tax=Janthinobacterium agaricidamnosum NBRC 102515 = DSM 9628 TaxID=1349767 RepID=W0V254_9BURK|nr:chorismate lyase [Janthinobacterium agaricidamnosum]CDG81413.1 chorismate lyase family protein [Janthinobacterium agaricidamnosum NBRC 102515 = DSM 9628]
MRPGSLRQVAWHSHINAVNAPSALRDWLSSPGSLTAKLKAHSHAFRVQCLHQQTARCLGDEARIIGLPRPGRVWQREVLLRCDNKPVVFAHTVVPMQATATDWPLFSALGERSLGTTLFGDRMVRRGTLAYARLRGGHPLAQRALAALGRLVGQERMLYARRCLYQRHQGLLLVTEVFLPEVLTLTPVPPGLILPANEI